MVKTGAAMKIPLCCRGAIRRSQTRIAPSLPPVASKEVCVGFHAVHLTVLACP